MKRLGGEAQLADGDTLLHMARSAALFMCADRTWRHHFHHHRCEDQGNQPYLIAWADTAQPVGDSGGPEVQRVWAASGLGAPRSQGL